MPLRMGPSSESGSIASGSTITKNLTNWAGVENTVVSVEPGSAVGSMDVSVKFLNGDSWFSMGTIDFTGAYVPLEIRAIGIVAVKLTPSGLDASWDYYVMGKDE